MTDTSPVNAQPLEYAQPLEAVETDYRGLLEIATQRHQRARRAVLEGLYPADDSNLVRHARTELERAGLFGEDSDYAGGLAESVMDLMRVFQSQGHSGGSAMGTIDLFRRLASFDVLTPITAHPDEWMEVGTGLWQNRRKSSTFWRAGEASWYDLDAPGRQTR